MTALTSEQIGQLVAHSQHVDEGEQREGHPQGYLEEGGTESDGHWELTVYHMYITAIVVDRTLGLV